MDRPSGQRHGSHDAGGLVECILTHIRQRPAANGIYFRAVASASGSVDSLSNIIGPYNLISETPPSVTLNQPAGSSGGNGTQEQPLVFVADLIWRS